MKKIALLVALSGLVIFAGKAMAQESPWQIKLRADHFAVADKSDPLAGQGASDRFHVNAKTNIMPDIGISYFFTPNWAAELSLSLPQTQSLVMDGRRPGSSRNFGNFKLMPSTLTMQYHFLPQMQFSPYLGAGLNYTRFSSGNLSYDPRPDIHHAVDGVVRLNENSWGLAFQAGVDYKLNQNWSLNLDVKKMMIQSDVYMMGGTVSTLKINPWMVGMGVGYRF